MHRLYILFFLCLSSAVLAEQKQGSNQGKIDRQALVTLHNPSLSEVDPLNPFTVGNGQFAFTADVTGLQSLYPYYYTNGTPLETKARWAWHSRKNNKNFRLDEVNKDYAAYGRRVAFPTKMDSEAGQWLRKNPHDLPLAQIGFSWKGTPLSPESLSNIDQTLELWTGRLFSSFTVEKEEVAVTTFVHARHDMVSTKVVSPLLRKGLSFDLRFPRGYKLDKKNTPAIDWSNSSGHTSKLLRSGKYFAIFERVVDDSRHFTEVSWHGSARLSKVSDHHYRLSSSDNQIELHVQFSRKQRDAPAIANYSDNQTSSIKAWREYWQSGAALSFEGSKTPLAKELERRIILSQYLLAVQGRAEIPAQETGLTSSSWYGKHHTEMTWWHSAHWILWGRPQQAKRVLGWYQDRLPVAQALAKSRGLQGARWAKMVDPQGRESPGGNPLIIWNQPQPIHLAALLLEVEYNEQVLREYAELVEETAKGLSSMLVWEQQKQRYSLLPPIWIAQEIYPATESKNPAFELSYWRYGLETAQSWRRKLGLPENKLWAQQIQHLAELPVKNGKYVAIESIPDTFDNPTSRVDHPTMLAPWGLLEDPRVNPRIMKATFEAVLDTWDWQAKIWGWDYPMIAMTAHKLGYTEQALKILLKEAPHNTYLINGHCPQQGSNLPVYLPANGALLSAIAMIVKDPRIRSLKGWNVQIEGF